MLPGNEQNWYFPVCRYKYYNSAKRKFCSNVKILLTFCMQEFFSSDLLEENHWFPQLLNFVEFFFNFVNFFLDFVHILCILLHMSAKKNPALLYFWTAHASVVKEPSYAWCEHKSPSGCPPILDAPISWMAWFTEKTTKNATTFGDYISLNWRTDMV